MNCLNCGKEVKQTEGKRQKLYCDNNGKCKNEYFRKQKSKSSDKCVMGCMHFTGGEIKHHKDCPFYPDSLSIRLDNAEAEVISLRNQLKQANLSPLNSKDNKTQAKEVKGAKMGVEVPNDLKESKSWIDKLQDNVDNQIKPTNLAELKALCPKNLVGLDRTVWIEENKSKYNL